VCGLLLEVFREGFRSGRSHMVAAPRTKTEVAEYAAAHNLEARLSTAVNKAIAAGSVDPLAYIATLLAAEASKEVVDYAAVKRELLLAMDNPSWDDGSLAPIFIRLAWHSSGTFDKATGTGGSNGAGMRFAAESGDPENAGLHSARAFLEPIKRKFPGVSYSDLWVLAAYVGLEHTGGPAMEFRPGRSDYVDDSAPTYPPNGRLPGAEKYITDGLDADGRPNGWQQLCVHLRDEVFYRMGFDDREIVALLCGGHVYGRCHPESSGYAGPWVEEPYKWSNEYAADMVGDEWRLVDDSDTWLDAQGAAELRPAKGKKQYVNKKKPDEIATPDASQYAPGKYKVATGWVNVRKDPDTKSDIIGQPTRDTELNLVAVKLFGTAVRGRLDTSGWVSIIATGGKELFERVGDLELKDGTYRTTVEQPLYAAAFGSDEAAERLPAGDVQLTSVSMADGAICGQTPGGGWLSVLSPQTGVVADRIEEGFNDKPPTEDFEDPPAPNQMMLLSDMVLAWDPAFRAVLEEYAEDEDLLSSDFGKAFKKLTELGCEKVLQPPISAC